MHAVVEFFEAGFPVLKLGLGMPVIYSMKVDLKKTLVKVKVSVFL